MTEEITEEQKQASENAVETAEAAVQQKTDQAAKAAEEAAAQAIDKANQAIADLPGKIEDVIKQFNETLKTLLGRVPDPSLDPDSPDFDINALIGQLTSKLTPLMSSAAPLASVTGPIPVVGDLSKMLPVLSQSAQPTPGVSSDDVKKLVPNKPEVPPALNAQLDKLQINIMCACMQLPIIFIIAICNMVNVIYSKLKIITSVIPLGSLYPLNLVDTAMTAAPLAKDLMTNMPGLMYDIGSGLIKQKMAEVQAMGCSIPKTLPVSQDEINTQKLIEQNIEKENKEAAVQAELNETPPSPPVPPPSPLPPAKPSVPEPKPNPPVAPKDPSLDEINEQFRIKFKELGVLYGRNSSYIKSSSSQYSMYFDDGIIPHTNFVNNCNDYNGYNSPAMATKIYETLFMNLQTVGHTDCRATSIFANNWLAHIYTEKYVNDNMLTLEKFKVNGGYDTLYTSMVQKYKSRALASKIKKSNISQDEWNTECRDILAQHMNTLSDNKHLYFSNDDFLDDQEEDIFDELFSYFEINDVKYSRN